MWKKFCEQDTNEENKLRMKYERRFRYLLRWNITNEEGLFKKELFDKQHAISLTRLGKYLFGYMCATSNIPYKYIGDYLYAIEKEKQISRWGTKGEDRKSTRRTSSPVKLCLIIWWKMLLNLSWIKNL